MSPRNKQQNQQIKDERREQLMTAALRVIARRGLAATKIGDIAAAAGLSHGLVYHYFESKEEIFIELVRRAVEQSSGALTELEAISMEPLQKIRFITESVLKGIDENEDSAYYFLLMIQASMSDANPGEAREYMQNATIPEEVMMRIVAEGQQKGVMREGNPHDYVILYWAAVQGLALYKISMGEKFKMPDAELLTRIFC